MAEVPILRQKNKISWSLEPFLLDVKKFSESRDRIQNVIRKPHDLSDRVQTGSKKHPTVSPGNK